jgi:beta-fructofuranosidase
MLDMTVNVRADAEDAYGLFEIHVASDDSHYTSIRYKRKDHFVTVDRRYSGIRNAVISKRSMKVKDLGGDIKLRIILDRYSVEVFINDGEQALSTVIYTDLSADTISFMADGKAIVDIDKHDLVMNQ